MYNRSIAVKDSTRVKLYMAKKRLDNESDFSDAYVRIYNRSLKENYNIWLKFEDMVKRVYDEYFREEDGFVVDRIAFIGRVTIALCKKLATWKLKVCRFLYSRFRK